MSLSEVEDKKGSPPAKDVLRLELLAFSQQNELMRILELSKVTTCPLEIIEYPNTVWIKPELDESVVKSLHREKSLLVHPDKCKLPNSKEAFELLKNAYQELMNPKKQKVLIDIVKEARDTVIQNRHIKIDFESPVLKMPGAAIINLIKAEVRASLAGERKRASLRLKNELRRHVAEAELREKERKRKLEYENEWEESRESRVCSWRKFIKSGGGNTRKPYSSLKGII